MTVDKTPKTNKEKLDFLIEQAQKTPNLSVLSELVEIVPDIKALVKERQEQEIFNRRAAKIGRWIVVVGAGIGTVIGTIWAVSQLIVTLGLSNRG